jgi:glycosyltransferase involved in cell wall biosynthesis
VIDNYNYGRFLRTAIDSVLVQTKAPAEIIVVDDGSADDSAEIIRSYGDRIVPVMKRNGGMGSALNAGFALATGDVVFFLDADDSMLPDAVETVLASWKPGVVLIHYLMEVVDAERRVLGVHPPPPHKLAEGDVRECLLKTGSFSTTLTSALAFSRAALLQVMPLDEAVFTQAADGYLVRAVAMLGPVQAIDRCLSRQCRHRENDSEYGTNPSALAASFRKRIRYTRNELDTVRTMAERLGLEVDCDLGEHDASYLVHRLFSLRLEPREHPLEDDKVHRLLRQYLRARWTQGGGLRGMVTDLAVATASTALPQALAAQLLVWRHAPTTRPKWLRDPFARRRRKWGSASVGP